MRLFVALELPPPVRHEAARRIAAERSRLPAARWTHADNLHLTLVFLGEVGESALDGLVAALAAAFAVHPPLTLRLAGAGTFPPPPASGSGKPGAIAASRRGWPGSGSPWRRESTACSRFGGRSMPPPAASSTSPPSAARGRRT